MAGRVPPPSAPQQAASAAPTTGGDSVATAGIPGPSAADLKAATAMTPSQQDELARSMVARLAARLEQNPRDADRWIMLMRSRMMLNDPTGARKRSPGRRRCSRTMRARSPASTRPRRRWAWSAEHPPAALSFFRQPGGGRDFGRGLPAHLLRLRPQPG
ncbi:hypothetical protein ACFSTI_23645 [Rhizorhabdus histidinilytica]